MQTLSPPTYTQPKPVTYAYGLPSMVVLSPGVGSYNYDDGAVCAVVSGETVFYGVSGACLGSSSSADCFSSDDAAASDGVLGSSYGASVACSVPAWSSSSEEIIGSAALGTGASVSITDDVSTSSRTFLSAPFRGHARWL